MVEHGCKSILKENFDSFMTQVTFSCWFIWKSRCEAVFNGTSPSPFRTLRSIATALVTFNEASNSRSLMAGTNTGLSWGMLRPPLWSPPPVNWIKLNVDACWKRDSLCGQVGVVARDGDFGCIALKCVRVHASKPAMAEALAVLEGCVLARNLQVQKVVIESDALAIIQFLNSLSMSCDWELLPIQSRALEIGRSFQSCSWSWSPRSANMVADFVARNLSPEMCGSGWVVTPPSLLVGILNKDGLPCPP